MSSEQLTPAEWHALNALADGSGPIEEVARTLRGEGLTLSPREFLATMFRLFRRGFVTVSQTPIPAFNQQFSERVITPSQPADIVGDLEAAFRETYEHGDYLSRVAIPADSAPAGVPLGIYFAFTPEGRAEWDKPFYKAYIDEPSV